nr:hypothetical protein [Pseudomonas luteola]
MGTDLALQQSGSAPSRELTYAAAIAKSLDLAQDLTARYVETREKAFSVAAAAAAKTARDLQAAQ